MQAHVSVSVSRRGIGAHGSVPCPQWPVLAQCGRRKWCSSTRSNSAAVPMISPATQAAAVPLDLAGASGPLAGPGSQALYGKRIIVTAPRQYSQKLCAKLINAGARPLAVPGVLVTELQDAQQRQDLAAALHRVTSGAQLVTHIAFTSKNGIHAVLGSMAALLGGAEAARAWLASRPDVRLCALGADADVLTSQGVTVHVVPGEASTLGLVRELSKRGEAQGAVVLCPVPHVAGGLVEPAVVPRFLNALQDAGAEALRLPAYLTTLGCSPADCALERLALAQGHVHAIAFSSTAEAQGLCQAMGGVAQLAQYVTQHGVVLAAHGPYTAEGAGNVLGLPVDCVSRSFSTFDGLVTALEERFAGSAGRGSSAA